MSWFYIIVSLLVVAAAAVVASLKFTKFKDSEKFTTTTRKVLKILVVIYASLMLVSVLLPDAFALCYSAEDLAANPQNVGYAIVRWFSMASFILLPVAVFYDNRTIRNIAIYFGVAVSVAAMFFFPQYMADFTSSAGRGLNSISVISPAFKNFLINPVFRGIWFGVQMTLQLAIPILLAINEKHMFKFSDWHEYVYFIVALPFVLISALPIYAPQHIFGLSDIIFKPYGIIHLLWVLVLVAQIVVLYFLFRKKDENTKMALLLVMALSLLMQYLQMFSAISINIARLPFQLCNLGAFFIMLSLITRNRKLFNFTVIINVIGVVIALARPDVDEKGLFYLYNMHFIFEHSNVLVIPVLALLFNLFPRLDKSALVDCLLGFTIYFVCAWALGTIFNAIALKTGNDFWSANYLFMFDAVKATKYLPFTKALFDINFKIGYATFYPVIQLVIYAVFMVVCTLLYFAIQLVYKISNAIRGKGKEKQPEAEA